MSTRSEVYIQHADGSIHGCYIHWDGYPKARGLQCLAHAEAGTLGEFIREHCENPKEDGYDFCHRRESELKKVFAQAPIDWIYVLHTDGSWGVWTQTYVDGKLGGEKAGDLWTLVAEDSGISMEELRKKVSYFAKRYRREYGKDDSKLYSIYITKLTVTDNCPKVEEREQQHDSFEKARESFQQLHDYLKRQWPIVSKTRMQIIAQSEGLRAVIVVTLV